MIRRRADDPRSDTFNLAANRSLAVPATRHLGKDRPLAGGELNRCDSTVPNPVDAAYSSFEESRRMVAATYDQMVVAASGHVKPSVLIDKTYIPCIEHSMCAVLSND
jgi:hypothetical protein